MKKTTVQFFCDKCGGELYTYPDRYFYAGVRRDVCGLMKHRCRVTIEYEEYMGVQFQESMLCGKCQMEALEEVLKKFRKARGDEQ